jgi:hypothetical protein
MIAEMGLVCLENEAFKAAWVSWIEHLNQKKKPPTNHAMQLQLKKLSEMGSEKAIQTLTNCIEKNWQGIYEKQNDLPLLTNAAPQKPAQSVFNLKTIIEAKQDQANALKARWAVETGLGVDWSSDQARADYRKIAGEIKQLKQQLAAMA